MTEQRIKSTYGINDIKKQRVLCPICEEEVEQKRGPGRIKESHDTCRKFLQLIGWLEDTITNDMPKTAASRKSIRSNLFRISNLANEMTADEKKNWTAEEMRKRC